MEGGEGEYSSRRDLAKSVIIMRIYNGRIRYHISKQIYVGACICV